MSFAERKNPLTAAKFRSNPYGVQGNGHISRSGVFGRVFNGLTRGVGAVIRAITGANDDSDEQKQVGTNDTSTGRVAKSEYQDNNNIMSIYGGGVVVEGTTSRLSNGSGLAADSASQQYDRHGDVATHRFYSDDRRSSAGSERGYMAASCAYNRMGMSHKNETLSSIASHAPPCNPNINGNNFGQSFVNELAGNNQHSDNNMLYIDINGSSNRNMLEKNAGDDKRTVCDNKDDRWQPSDWAVPPVDTNVQVARHIHYHNDDIGINNDGKRRILPWDIRKQIDGDIGGGYGLNGFGRVYSQSNTSQQHTTQLQQCLSSIADASIKPPLRIIDFPCQNSQLTALELQQLYNRCHPLRWRVRLRELFEENSNSANADSHVENEPKTNSEANNINVILKEDKLTTDQGKANNTSIGIFDKNKNVQTGVVAFSKLGSKENEDLLKESFSQQQASLTEKHINSDINVNTSNIWLSSGASAEIKKNVINHNNDLDNKSLSKDDLLPGKPRVTSSNIVVTKNKTGDILSENGLVNNNNNTSGEEFSKSIEQEKPTSTVNDSLNCGVTSFKSSLFNSSDSSTGKQQIDNKASGIFSLSCGKENKNDEANKVSAAPSIFTGGGTLNGKSPETVIATQSFGGGIGGGSNKTIFGIQSSTVQSTSLQESVENIGKDNVASIGGNVIGSTKTNSGTDGVLPSLKSAADVYTREVEKDNDTKKSDPIVKSLTTNENLSRGGSTGKPKATVPWWQKNLGAPCMVPVEDDNLDDNDNDGKPSETKPISSFGFTGNKDPPSSKPKGSLFGDAFSKPSLISGSANSSGTNNSIFSGISSGNKLSIFDTNTSNGSSGDSVKTGSDELKPQGEAKPSPITGSSSWYSGGNTSALSTSNTSANKHEIFVFGAGKRGADGNKVEGGSGGADRKDGNISGGGKRPLFGGLSSNIGNQSVSGAEEKKQNVQGNIFSGGVSGMPKPSGESLFGNSTNSSNKSSNIFGSTPTTQSDSSNKGGLFNNLKNQSETNSGSGNSSIFGSGINSIVSGIAKGASLNNEDVQSANLGQSKGILSGSSIFSSNTGSSSFHGNNPFGSGASASGSGNSGHSRSDATGSDGGLFGAGSGGGSSSGAGGGAVSLIASNGRSVAGTGSGGSLTGTNYGGNSIFGAASGGSIFGIASEGSGTDAGGGGSVSTTSGSGNSVSAPSAGGSLFGATGGAFCLGGVGTSSLFGAGGGGGNNMNTSNETSSMGFGASGQGGLGSLNKKSRGGSSGDFSNGGLNSGTNNFLTQNRTGGSDTHNRLKLVIRKSCQ